jgi:SulP family sulfate permease
VLATVIAGVILVIAGWRRIGNLVAYVPEAVVNGFTIGITIIVAASQINDFLGLKLASVPADFLPKMQALWAASAGIDAAALGAGLAALALTVAMGAVSAECPRSPRCG